MSDSEIQIQILSSMLQCTFQAIDVWMSTCLVFVFAALVEYSFVNVFARRPITRFRSAVNAVQEQNKEKSLEKNIHADEETNGGGGGAHEAAKVSFIKIHELRIAPTE